MAVTAPLSPAVQVRESWLAIPPAMAQPGPVMHQAPGRDGNVQASVRHAPGQEYMAAVHEMYTREMYQQYSYFAGWLPSQRLALGDVGQFSGYRFEKLTTLTEMGLGYARSQEDFPAELEYSSKGQVTVSAGAELGLAAGAEPTAVRITFGREGAIFFQAAGCVMESIGNLPALEAALLRLRTAGTWRPGYIVVAQVLRTGPATILVSDQRGAQIELRAGTGTAPAAPLLATAAGNLSILARSGLAASVIAPDGATPLFGAVRLRRKLTGHSRLVFRSSGSPASHELAPCTLADLDSQDEPG
jgi:hypothetical protein